MHSFFDVRVSECKALVSAQVFCPGNHEKYLEVAVRIFQVSKDSPAVGTVATTNALIPMYCLQQSRFPLRLYVIFNCDENWAGIGCSWTHLQYREQSPISGLVREVLGG